MRWWTIAGFVGSVSLQAQLTMPVGIVRGDVVAWTASMTGSSRSGELEIRNPESDLYSCLYDARTYFERERQVIAVTALSAGDPVEVVVDRRPGSGACYARTVHVVEKHAQRIEPGMRPRLRLAPSPRETFAPRGNLTFGGVVVRSDEFSMTVKTREGEVRLVLRPDTRYVGDGVRVDATTPLVNKHVFVRAGRDIEGGLEAYQIIWGDTIAPE